MNYREATDFLFGSLPMYQRQGKAAYKANLDNTRRLDSYFGHPHQSFPTIHVAGTNGKGSVSHMLASVLQEAGFSTGLYTSPHLVDFRERIRINGIPVPEQDVISFVKSHRKIIGELHPSFFEMTVAMAFDTFARNRVDVAVIETGLGGRLDSTNIITPVCSVITNISLDHTEFLGNDLLSIAKEKGGIIKKGIPLILGYADGDIEALYSAMAAEKDCVLIHAQHLFEMIFKTFTPEGKSMIRFRDIRAGKSGSITTDLLGNYQQENLFTVLATISMLRKTGWAIPPESVETGLANVVASTGFLGRWQTVGTNPRIICDTAHNQAGIAAVMQQIIQTPWKKLHVVWGMVDDKDVSSILPLLPADAQYYFTSSSVPRSMDAQLLHEKAAACNLTGASYHSVQSAYHAALQKAEYEDMIFVGGSTYVVADMLKALGY